MDKEGVLIVVKELLEKYDGYDFAVTKSWATKSIIIEAKQYGMTKFQEEMTK